MCDTFWKQDPITLHSIHWFKWSIYFAIVIWHFPPPAMQKSSACLKMDSEDVGHTAYKLKPQVQFSNDGWQTCLLPSDWLALNTEASHWLAAPDPANWMCLQPIYCQVGVPRCRSAQIGEMCRLSLLRDCIISVQITRTESLVFPSREIAVEVFPIKRSTYPFSFHFSVWESLFYWLQFFFVLVLLFLAVILKDL